MDQIGWGTTTGNAYISGISWQQANQMMQASAPVIGIPVTPDNYHLAWLDRRISEVRVRL